jgi:uncharacterized protein YjbI with pentapeptide repeats
MDEHTLRKLQAHGVDEKSIGKRDLSRIDLSGKDLPGVDLRDFTIAGTNFEAADLSGSDLRGLRFARANCVTTRFTGADLRGANLAFGYFNNADFRGADLRGARVADSLCSDSTFAGADLRGAKLGAEHYNSDFRGADLRGIDMPEDSDFTKLECDMSGAILTPPQRARNTNLRRLPRVAVVPRLNVFDRKTSEQVGELVDVTVEGMRLNGPYPNPVGTFSYFQIALPDTFPHGTALHVDARSVWCKPVPEDNRFDTGFLIQNIGEGREMIEKLIDECREATGRPAAKVPGS